MGDVYRARDTVLDRDVALKVLPRSLAADPERLARFQREAKVLASLNHPNIAQIYGVEQDALVMELVDGETLKRAADGQYRARLCGSDRRGARSRAREGCRAPRLEAGQRHDDGAGVVKVLDFGLAAVEHDLSRDDPRAADEAPGPVNTTRAGAIMGTAAYMSPEQASGHAVDKRADIWSFGAVFWELLTGRALFEADTVSETLSNVTTAPIDWQRLPRETPTAIRDLLARCLDRDARTRLRDIGEARIQIQRSLAATPQSASAFSRQRLARAVTWVSIGLAVVFAALFVTERRAARPPELREPMTFHIPVPPQATVAGGPALSPDGRHVAFTAKSADGRVRIWIHSLNSGEAHPLPGTEDAFSLLFWSPDSRFVGFAAGMTLKKVAAAGGPPVTLCDRCGPASIGSRAFRGASWNATGVIVYAISSNGLWRIPDTGGAPDRVTPAGDYGYPAFLPDGEHLLYTWFGRDPQPGVYVAALGSHEQRPARRLVDGPFVLSTYAPSRRPEGGYLLVLRDGTLSAQPFDAKVPDIERRASVGCGRCTRHEPAFGVLHVIDGGARVQHVHSGGHFTPVVVRPHGQAVRPARTTIVRFEHQYLVRWQPDRIRSLGVGSTYAPHLECRSGTWRTDAVE